MLPGACGLLVEEIEDFRLLIDEICEAMVDSSRGASVHVVFRMVENRLIVEAATEAGPQPEPDRFALGDEILAVLADSHERVVEGGQLRYIASRNRRSGGVG